MDLNVIKKLWDCLKLRAGMQARNKGQALESRVYRMEQYPNEVIRKLYVPRRVSTGIVSAKKVVLLNLKVRVKRFLSLKVATYFCTSSWTNRVCFIYRVDAEISHNIFQVSEGISFNMCAVSSFLQ